MPLFRLCLGSVFHCAKQAGQAWLISSAVLSLLSSVSICADSASPESNLQADKHSRKHCRPVQVSLPLLVCMAAKCVSYPSSGLAEVLLEGIFKEYSAQLNVGN